MGVEFENVRDLVSGLRYGILIVETLIKVSHLHDLGDCGEA